MDYKFSDVGNLGIRKEIYMPNDNCIITDETISIGNSSFKVNQFEKENVLLGLKKGKNGSFDFWLSSQKMNLNLSVFEK